jgi:hypothetical protein
MTTANPAAGRDAVVLSGLDQFLALPSNEVSQYLQIPQNLQNLQRLLNWSDNFERNFSVLLVCLSCDPVLNKATVQSLQALIEIALKNTEKLVGAHSGTASSLHCFLKLCIGRCHDFNAPSLKRTLISALCLSRAPLCYHSLECCTLKSVPWLLQDWLLTLRDCLSSEGVDRAVVVLIDDTISFGRLSMEHNRLHLFIILAEAVNCSVVLNSLGCLGMWNSLWDVVKSGPQSACCKKLVSFA